MQSNPIQQTGQTQQPQPQASAQGAGGSPAGGSLTTQAMGKDAFLKLLVTQLEHQDPLDPMDNTDFVAQLAQFSSLEGITNLGTSMDRVAGKITSMSNLFSSNLVGRKVTAAGNAFTYSGSPVTLAYSLSGGATKVNVTVHDASGAVIRTLKGSGGPSGDYTVTWDGRDLSGMTVKPGTYTFNVTASDGAGSPVAATTYVTDTVTKVALTGSAPQLVLGGNARIAADRIKEIF
ncbi:MAG TPA: hypothetical protein ENJ37_01665 [Deltaproteobacteria bacterium]|nr:hypothetical protein [Deltaproteobacteria bacterium]